MQGGGLTPGDGWNVALLFVEVALGTGVALVLLCLAGGLGIIIVRSALHAELKGSGATAGDTGQQPAVGAVAPRLTPTVGGRSRLASPDWRMPANTDRSNTASRSTGNDGGPA